MSRFLMAIDQGTTSSRVIIFDEKAKPVGQHQIEFAQYFPKSGWVEHDADEIWQTTLSCCHKAIENGRITSIDIAAIGITNQRETTVIWERATGKPIYNAIVWQDRRTAELCHTLKLSGHEPFVQKRTGLLLDPYFSASKIAWILQNVPNAHQRAEKGELAFGTIDSFLLWRLTDGKQHATDVTNASRTLLFNIRTHQWDKDLLNLFDIPNTLLPKVLDNCAEFGVTNKAIFDAEIPITAMAGDQHAAMIGQCCFQKGMIKSTYGTGAFMMLNTGQHAITSKNRLLTTIGYRLAGETMYALEGSIFSAGTIVKWLRDKLQLVKHVDEISQLAKSIPDNGGVYLVPAFTGLGAPYWDPEARGAIEGLTRDTQAAHIVRAGLEAVAYQTRDLVGAMLNDSTLQLTEIRVDGGMVVNDWLMQFLADVVNSTVTRPVITETTALGAAYLAGLGVGIFESLEQLSQLWHCERKFIPTMPLQLRESSYQGWLKAVNRVLVGSV